MKLETAITREQLLAGRSFRVEGVPMSDFDGQVFVREMSAGEQDRFQLEASKDSVIRARLVSICACDEHGVRLFSDFDVAALKKLPASVIEVIFDAAQRLNRLTEDDAREMEKN